LSVYMFNKTREPFWIEGTRTLYGWSTDHQSIRRKSGDKGTLTKTSFDITLRITRAKNPAPKSQALDTIVYECPLFAAITAVTEPLSAELETYKLLKGPEAQAKCREIKQAIEELTGSCVKRAIMQLVADEEAEKIAGEARIREEQGIAEAVGRDYTATFGPVADSLMADAHAVIALLLDRAGPPSPTDA